MVKKHVQMSSYDHVRERTDLVSLRNSSLFQSSRNHDAARADATDRVNQKRSAVEMTDWKSKNAAANERYRQAELPF
jgi:hypothetical protein